MVMFHARLQSTGEFTYASNQVIVFKNVLVNGGEGYNPNTGHFTAPVAGAYFTVQYCPMKDPSACIDIVHDGKPLQRSRHSDGTYYLCVTMQALAKVAMGDKVWVRSYGDSKVYQYDEYYWNSFAGMLIHI
ncbi:hypothetical protein DPMN_022535 [Dreissena polymorpha]|uniref:C1q domain-containing protein n=2 Tax=Dreissena polymorpha TaxID=45954 RepID=A0A9D4NKI6_DREPO|nr:hypothetical protein DPMN_022535 [Dreissena polymorpha]